MVSTEVETGLNLEFAASSLGGKIILTLTHHDFLLGQHCSICLLRSTAENGFGALRSLFLRDQTGQGDQMIKRL